MKKKELLYSGKAKSIYKTDNSGQVIVQFRDDTSAFNGEKVEQLKDKGAVNNQLNHFFMTYLAEKGVATHHIERLNERESLVKSLDMLPIECVVRNIAAGSFCRRFGLEEGTELDEPIFEFFYKDDALGDPLINTSHIHAFKWATDEEVTQLQSLSLQVNTLLQSLFEQSQMILVDFKLEFGRADGQLYLGDEFTPDNCRIWDQTTKVKMDKDRFRQGLGDVIASYKQVADRLGVDL